MDEILYSTGKGHWGNPQIQQVRDDLSNLANVDLNHAIDLLNEARDRSREIPTERGRFITNKLNRALQELVLIKKYLESYEPKVPDEGTAIG